MGDKMCYNTSINQKFEREIHGTLDDRSDRGRYLALFGAGGVTGLFYYRVLFG
jgi:hypothetical protein